MRKQSETPALGIDDDFVVQRAVPEMKDEPAGNSIAARGLYQIAVSQRCSLNVPEDEEAMD
jgi:hypothetical protein